MCLTITNLKGIRRHNTKPKARVATKSITVFKRVDSIKRTSCISAIQGFKYIFGRLYKTKMRVECYGKVYQVQDGFHSYATKIDGYGVVKCIIPKGAKYYVEIVKDAIPVYVSDKICIVGKMDDIN